MGGQENEMCAAEHVHAVGRVLQPLLCSDRPRSVCSVFRQRRRRVRVPTKTCFCPILPDGTEKDEPALRALLQHSPLSSLQWVNLARHRIQFVTLEKQKFS
jgi:hypothetical protein